MTAVFPDDRRDDDEKGKQAHDVDGRTALVRLFHEQEADAIQALDDESRRERQKQRVTRRSPELEKKHARGERSGDDDAKQEAFDHGGLNHFPIQGRTAGASWRPRRWTAAAHTDWPTG